MPDTDNPDTWRVLLVDDTGDVTTLEDVHRYELGPDDIRVVIARRSARPTPDGRLPGTYDPGDVVVEYEGFYTLAEISQRYEQATAMATGLNAATVPDTWRAGDTPTITGAGAGAGKTSGTFLALLHGIRLAAAAGDLNWVRTLAYRGIGSEPPTGQPADPAVYGWVQVAIRTGFELDDLNERITAWPREAGWIAPDGRCTAAGLAELMRQAKSEGEVAAAVAGTVWRHAANYVRDAADEADAARGASADLLAKLTGLADTFDGHAAADEQATAGRKTAEAAYRDAARMALEVSSFDLVHGGIRVIASDRVDTLWRQLRTLGGPGPVDPAEAVTWEQAAEAAGLDAEELRFLTGLLATLTPAGDPTTRTRDLLVHIAEQAAHDGDHTERI